LPGKTRIPSMNWTWRTENSSCLRRIWRNKSACLRWQKITSLRRLMLCRWAFYHLGKNSLFTKKAEKMQFFFDIFNGFD
jgi:hypothetical protein